MVWHTIVCYIVQYKDALINIRSLTGWRAASVKAKPVTILPTRINLRAWWSQAGSGGDSATAIRITHHVDSWVQVDSYITSINEQHILNLKHVK